MIFSANKKTDPSGSAPRRPLLPRWGVILLLSVILFSVILYTFFRPPLTTEATSPPEPKPALAEKIQLTPSDAVAINTEKLSTVPSIWPAKGVVTSGFGWRISPFGDGNELHEGLDIAYPLGAPVVATADGKVILSGWYGGYGNAVEIDHGNGISTVYGHNSQLAASAGQQVKKGQVISYAGSTAKAPGLMFIMKFE